MFKWFKKKLCKHDYQLLNTFISDGDETIGYKATEFAVIYCPKCTSKRTVTKLEFDCMKEMQRIDEEYAVKLEQQRDNQQS